MTQTHIPVLAGELIDVIDPHPGEVAVDCTVGGGGHARLIADRLGPSGTLIGIDRDPIAEERFADLSAEVSCHTRFLRADFVTALEQLADEDLAADLASPRPRNVLDAGRHLGARLLVRVRRSTRHADGSRSGPDRARDRQRVG